MTEQVQTMSADSGQSVSIESSNVNPAAPAQPEKSFTQADVDRVAGKIREDAYQKGLRDAVNRVQQQPEPTYQQQQQPVMQQPQHVGGIPQQSPEQIRAMIAEENQRMKMAENQQQLINSLVAKCESVKGKYADFEDVVKPLNFLNSPVWHVAEKFDNAADVIYHLGKNPGKWAQLLTVGYSPVLVERGMREISESLKQNESASEQTQPNAPLSRPTPSNTGMGNGNKTMTSQDWKKILRV